MKYPNIREEELKGRVEHDYFDKFDTTEIIKDIDFAVKFRHPANQSTLVSNEYLLWAEAKSGSSDIFASFVQLILTIGQSGTVGSRLPPTFLGAFDSEKIAFISYNDIADVFTRNDFNWKVTPSNHGTKEFHLLYNRVQQIIEGRMCLYDFEKDEAILRHFIQNNLPAGQTSGKVQITKNNFIHIYRRWLEEVKPHIDFPWEAGKKEGILELDFYRADLFVDDKNTENIDDDTAITDRLSVIFRRGEYRINLKVLGDSRDVPYGFRQGGRQAYIAFWKKYKRPPLQEYQEFIINRRDLLVHQDIRERKGSFFTPQKWVALSQQYIADVLGVGWQEEYYVWDCAAGTGNLLVGLTEKYNIWASTLDQTDVNTMNELIVGDSLQLLSDHVFQFDFLNDEFLPKSKGGKLPDGLYDIISNEEKRKKLVIYINPPYKRGLGVANTKWHKKEMGEAKDELFAQFIYRVYCQIPSCVLAEFSKLKILQAPNFQDFRQLFRAKLEKFFVVPADTFDNVSGDFPVGFIVWDTEKKEFFSHGVGDVYDRDGFFIQQKGFYSYDNCKLINTWLNEFSSNKRHIDIIGFLNAKCNDFQHNKRVAVGSENVLSRGDVHKVITKFNLINISVYFAVRKVILADWLNDRDQFLYPNDGWKADTEFQNDCLAYTLFSMDNRIQSGYGANHWLPFTEAEVNARDRFDSRFMTDFIEGKKRGKQVADLFSGDAPQDKPAKLEFSPEATAVFDAGRELWRYYHAQTGAKSNVNASLYDIREYFQGRNDKGKMNNKSSNERYNALIDNLRSALKILAKKIEPKVYEYRFLKS